MMEKHVAKVDEGRHRCVHCSKLFKGPDFVVKHLRLKHEDVVKTATLETAMVNAFLAHPISSAIPTVAPARRKSDPMIDRPLRDREHRGRDSRSRPHRPLPPPRDAVQDPRRIRQYVDWDAPAAGDMEISYD
jgi:hypothetical protein